jgi:radical SAM protein with 4Fe4S-binding SPASM domain
MVSQRDNRTLLYVPESHAVSVLNPAGREVWALFESPTTPRHAAANLASRREWNSRRAARFVQMLDILLERGILVSGDSVSDADPEGEDGAKEDRQLSEIYLHLTNRCNLRCIYCYNAEFRAGKGARDELDAAEWRTVVEEAAGLGAQQLVISGGEPLLRAEECLDIARHARMLDMSSTCLTNGSLLASHVSEVAAAFDEVVVSVDSWREEEQRRTRPGCELAEILRGVRNLVDAGGAGVWIRPVITRYNVKNLPEFPRFAARHLHCADFMVALCSPTTAGNFDNLDLLPEPEDYLRALRQFHEAIVEEGGSASIESAPLELVGCCGAGTGLLSIAPDGGVYPCQCLHFEDLRAGNVREESLERIWSESHRLRDFRSGEPPRFGACGDCAIRKLCPLICRAVHYSFADLEGRFTRRMCPLARLEVEERLWRRAQQCSSKDRGHGLLRSERTDGGERNQRRELGTGCSDV